ncbi:SpoIIE family protein phosphatase [Streptomyces sp. NPDC007929]|uniref:SpoIIE family protein phosphatase n=1 Tax=Streptomyces sp. NPDC007929 TaxID=3364795 RepID=UPI0036E661ED
MPVQEGPVADEPAPSAEVITPSAAAPGPERTRAHATLSNSSLAPGAARALVRAALAEWTALGLPGAEHLTDRLADDATLVVSELVTNAVVHAGTDVETECRLEGDTPDTAAVVVEVCDHHPSRAPRGSEPETAHDTPEYGRGLRLVGALSEAWGITYRTGRKTVWARLPAAGCAAGEQIEAYAGEHALARGLRVAEILAPEPRRGAEPAEEAAEEPAEAPAEDPAEDPVSEPRRGEGPREAWAAEPCQGDGAGANRASRVSEPRQGDGVGEVRAAELPRAEGAGESCAAALPRGDEAVEAVRAWRAEGETLDLRAEGEAWDLRAGGEAWGLWGSCDGGEKWGRRTGGDPWGLRDGGGAWDSRGEAWDSPGGGEVWDSREGGESRVRPASREAHDLRDWNDLRDWRDRHENRDGRNGPDGAWLGRGALSFLAEASDLLAGQLDEDLVAALAGQLIVPRLADWCAVWLEDEATGGGWSGGAGAGGPRLARVWHGSENRIEELRRVLEKDPPQPLDPTGSSSPFERGREGGGSGPVDYPWPGEALGEGESGSALAYRLVAGGRPLGTLVIGRSGKAGFPDEITGLAEDLSRRVALAIGAARQYARQATISAVLQRGLLPGAVAEIPGMRSALVYEPCDKGGPSGDFYDLFPAGAGRWCFAVGDVQGKGPEAAVVIGLARPWLRLLAREGYRVADVLDRLNQLLLDDATEAADAAARALVAAGARPTPPGDGPQTRFLSLLYGELVPFDGGVRCTVASAGHPLPLLLGAGGEVHTAAQPQTLLGVVEDATYTSETFELRSGDTLLCVTDGVTERRSGSRQFDDGDGLATALAGCAGLDADLIAERIKRLVHDFGARPPADDLALLVLQAD